MSEAETDDQRSWHFRRLKWSLQALATSGGQQPTLFQDLTVNPGELAADFDHWSNVVRTSYVEELNGAQTAALDAIDSKLAMMSRDSAEFDLDLWTDAAVRSSEHWVEIRALAAAAIDAFGWPVEGPEETELKEVKK